jgi:hypothetical protein
MEKSSNIADEDVAVKLFTKFLHCNVVGCVWSGGRRRRSCCCSDTAIEHCSSDVNYHKKNLYAFSQHLDEENLDEQLFVTFVVA